DTVCGFFGGKLALKADAEQAVDHQIPALAGRNALNGIATIVAPGAIRGLGIGGEFGCVASERDANLEPPRFQVARDNECIAAVVAGTGDDQYAPAAIADQIARDL